MTKAELIKMVEHLNDNDEVMFVYEGTDFDGYPEDRVENIYKVLNKNKAEWVKGKCGIHRYEEIK